MSDEDWDRYETYLINIEKQLDADIAALEARTAAAKQRIAERAVQIAAAEERIAQHETDIAENQRIIDQSRANTAAMQAEIDAIDKETQAIVAEITHKAEQLLTLAETDPSVLDHPDTRAGINMIITSPSSAITPAMRERARKVLIKNGYQLADN